MKKKKKKGGFDVISLILIIIAVGILGFAGTKLYFLYQEYQVGTKEYDSLRKYAEIPANKEELLKSGTKKKEKTDTAAGEEKTEDEDAADGILIDDSEEETETEMEYMENPIDFEELKSINPDIIGWLELEGPGISYPIAHGSDNEFYLHHTIEGTYNFAGSIFVDFANSSDFSDENTVIYGHNMKNGSMFAMLSQYGKQEFYEKYPEFWIYTPEYIYKMEIFSAGEVTKDTSRYQIRFQDRAVFSEFLEKCVSESVISTAGMMFNSKDRVVTLSTCTGDSSTRFLLQAKIGKTYRTWLEDGEEESEENE